MKPSDRLKELRIVLPTLAAPIGSYLPAVRCGSLIYSSGQLPFRDGKLTFAGKALSQVSVPQAQEAAGTAVLNALSACAQAAGGIDFIRRVVRVCVFVNSDPEFSEQPKVANGASDFLVQVFGDSGRHARSAVGAAALPLNAPVEVELIVEAASPE
jgi:enamine deaminase RidA (YjgF/YER057c/UK114 family)